MCTITQFGHNYYIVCDHPPPLDVMSELLGQGRIGVEISVCVVPDASTAICVCSEFIRLLPNNFSWSLHLACSSRVVSISDIWCLRCSLAHHMDCHGSSHAPWHITYPGLTNTEVLTGWKEPSNLTLFLWCFKRGWKHVLASDTLAFLQKFLHLHSFHLQSISLHKKLFLNTNLPLVVWTFPSACCWWLVFGLLVCWNLGNEQRRQTWWPMSKKEHLCQ